MKGILITCTLLIIWAGVSSAEIISINIKEVSAGLDGAMVSTDTAGAPGARAANWNNISADYTDTLAGSNAVYNTGATVGGLFQAVLTTDDDTYVAPGSVTNDAALYYAGNLLNSSGEKGSLALSGIPFAQYAIYVYLADPSSGSGHGGSVTLGSTTYYQKDGSSATGADDYVLVDSTYYSADDIANSGSAGNYVKFDGLSGSSQTIDYAVLDMGLPTQLRFKPVGFQIVETVPEPATVSMLAIGALVGVLTRRLKV